MYLNQTQILQFSLQIFPNGNLIIINFLIVFFILLSSEEWFLLSHFLTEGVSSNEQNGRPIRSIIIRLATSSTVRRLLQSEYMIFILENPLSVSSELIIFLAFCTLEGTSAFARLLDFARHFQHSPKIH